MKTLTVSEALIALGNGEKITSDDLQGNGNFIFLGMDGIRWGDDETPCDKFTVLGGKNLRIYEEFTYPMWFENTSTKAIVKFSSLNKGIYVTAGVNRKVGEACGSFISHTDVSCWQQVEEPKKMIKVAKYAFESGSGWRDTKEFYKNNDEFVDVSGWQWNYKRLDYTEIEVEDYE